MTNVDPSEPNVDPPRSGDPKPPRTKTPYRERLRSPSNINTFRSISILVVPSVIMFGITLLLAFTLPVSPEFRATTILILIAVTLGSRTLWCAPATPLTSS